MTRPLYDKLKEYAHFAKARFCMPGHSGKGVEDEQIFSACGFDWTEVAGLDNLLQSEEVILESEKLFAKSYGYKYALMLTQGATVGMQIAVNIAKQKGKGIVALGNMHKSFWSACQLFGVECQYVDNLNTLKKLSTKIDISSIFVTTPDYFGHTTDLSELSEFAKSKNAILVVDEAHSAHFVFSSLLPDNASRFADISLIGMHKTLPVYGGGALVCVNNENLYALARQYRALLHSTSPNYLIMASMDYARDYMQKYGEKLYAETKKKIEKFCDRLSIGKVVNSDDFSRVVVKIEGVDCYELSDELAKRGVFVETAYGDELVLIVTPFNADKLEYFADILPTIPMKQTTPLVLPKFKNTTVDSTQIELVNVDDIDKRISAGEIGIYPPGVPVIRRGDVLDKQAIEFIKKYNNRLFGLASGKVAVLK